jgi:hypothetical protein
MGSDWFLENVTLANRVTGTCRTGKGEGEEEGSLYGCHPVVLINKVLAVPRTPPTHEQAAPCTVYNSVRYTNSTSKNIW